MEGAPGEQHCYSAMVTLERTFEMGQLTLESGVLLLEANTGSLGTNEGETLPVSFYIFVFCSIFDILAISFKFKLAVISSTGRIKTIVHLIAGIYCFQFGQFIS